MTPHQQATRRSSSERRRLIVEAAASIIAEQGLARTRARDIAAAAGVSLGTVTYHFSSVPEILIAALQRETDRFEATRHQRMAEAADPVERISRFMTAYVDPDAHPPAMWRIWFDCWSLASRDPEIRRWQLTRYHGVFDELVEMIDAATATDGAAIVDSHDVAREFIALADGLGEQSIIGPDIAPGRAARIVAGAVHRRLRPATPLEKT